MADPGLNPRPRSSRPQGSIFANINSRPLNPTGSRPGEPKPGGDLGYNDYVPRVPRPENGNPFSHYSTHPDGNQETISPHLPFHQHDGEDASATLEESASAAWKTGTATYSEVDPLDVPSIGTYSSRVERVSSQGYNVPARGSLVPQHMLPQPLDFFISPHVRESIATQNEARLNMMIERIQRGQMDFVFDRRQLVWTWEGMRGDLIRAAEEDRITALINNAELITDDPYDSDGWAPSAYPPRKRKAKMPSTP
ncbi:hypothetical protein Neosp_014282 [[Neocosmospora] mangrovei]